MSDEEEQAPNIEAADQAARVVLDAAMDQLSEAQERKEKEERERRRQEREEVIENQKAVREGTPEEGSLSPATMAVIDEQYPHIEDSESESDNDNGKREENSYINQDGNDSDNEKKKEESDDKGRDPNWREDVVKMKSEA